MDTDKPVITLALQTEIPSGRKVWNLYTGDGDQLVGWTPDLPGPLTTRPSCFQYGTGTHLEVTLAPHVNTVGLDW